MTAPQVFYLPSTAHLPPPRVTIQCMQLLFERLSSEGLACTLEEQLVWGQLESGATFLDGVSLLARWGPGFHRIRVCRGILCSTEGS